MSRSLNAKVNSLNETPSKRKIKYDKKNSNRVRGQSGTSRIKNLHTAPVAVNDENYEITKCNDVERKSIFSKIISRFR